MALTPSGMGKKKGMKKIWKKKGGETRAEAQGRGKSPRLDSSLRLLSPPPHDNKRGIGRVNGKKKNTVIIYMKNIFRIFMV